MEIREEKDNAEISKLKKKEEDISSAVSKPAVGENEEQFKVISETSPQAIMIYQDNKWVYANKAAENISGYKEEELKKMNFWEFVHPDYRELVKKMGSNRQVNRRAEKEYEFKIISKDGKEKWVWLNGASTIFNRKPAAIISVQDISERKEAETKLQESEERFKFLTKATFEGIVIHKKGIVIDTNDSFLNMTGYERDEVIGQNLLDYIPLLKDRMKIMINIVKHKAAPYIITARRKQGSYFTAELEAKNVKHNGKAVRIVAVRDVTVRIEAQKQLQQAHERLEIMNSILRHDISNELSVIDSALELYLETDNRDMLSEMRKRINKCINTIREQHYLAKELKNKKSGKKEFALKEVLKQVKDNYPDVKINLEGDAVVLANAAIFSVFDNLVSNSIVHGKAEKINISIEQDEEYTILIYKDDGKGIKDELKDKVFEKGFIAGKSGHTGIGLHIVSKTVSDYGGKITIEDNNPQGVIFRIFFPRIIIKN